MKWDLYLSNMNWRGIFWTPNIVHLQYQISQVVYMKECMNTHCKISLYRSNRFTVYFDFFCFTWEMFSLYLYNRFCICMVNKDTVIYVERYLCQLSVFFFFLILTERRMFQQILVKSLNMKFHGNQVSGSHPDMGRKTGRNCWIYVDVAVWMWVHLETMYESSWQ